MDDIERYSFWHAEKDAELKEIREMQDHQIKLQIIDSSLVNLKMSKSIFDYVTRGRADKNKGA